jgi:CheY-like chemotaxis protein
MSVQVLLLSQDRPVLGVFRRVCEENGITLQYATESAEAAAVLARSKIDGFIADCDDVVGAAEVIVNLRKGTSNKSAVVFVLRAGEGLSVRTAFNIGANFVLDKPVTHESVSRCLSVAHGLLLRERRKYFRVPAAMPAELTLADGSKFAAAIANISEGGISIRGSIPAAAKSKMRIGFRLPGTEARIDVKGELVWKCAVAHAGGLQFLFMNDKVQRELQVWLNYEMQRKAPLLVNGNRSRA